MSWCGFSKWQPRLAKTHVKRKERRSSGSTGHELQEMCYFSRQSFMVHVPQSCGKISAGLNGPCKLLLLCQEFREAKQSAVYIMAHCLSTAGAGEMQLL